MDYQADAFLSKMKSQTLKKTTTRKQEISAVRRKETSFKPEFYVRQVSYYLA